MWTEEKEQQAKLWAERLKEYPLTRRAFLEKAGSGFGLAALSCLLGEGQAFSQEPSSGSKMINPLAPKLPHFPVKARSVIWLFMAGGPSQMDTFDPKPLLSKLAGQRMPESFGTINAQFTDPKAAPLLASGQTFKRHGQSGLEISGIFPEIARHADDLAVVRSCYHDGFNHSPALYAVTSGHSLLGKPSVGAWVVYGLGSENQNLPAYVVMLSGALKSGPLTYGAGFLPATYQGTVLRTTGTPILNLTPDATIGARRQREIIDLVNWHNERHLAERAMDSDLSARISAYELAFRMQTEAPEVMDISGESAATQQLYGIDKAETSDYGAKCLLARRLVEKGVRFVQIFSGKAESDIRQDWDAHEVCDNLHVRMGRGVDKPIAGLLTDLKQRGLLDSTLVIWGGEFGRTPFTNGGAGNGRDHNPYGFTMWMAGGGIKGGRVIGSTDEIGLRAAEQPKHIHDIHATWLSLLGIDHKKQTFLFQGRNQRLTDIGGEHEFSKELLS
jgi:hypothetical protein